MYNITLFGKPVNRLDSEKIIINRCSKKEVTVHCAEYNTWINNCKKQLRGKYKFDFSGRIYITVSFYADYELSKKECEIFTKDVIEMLKTNGVIGCKCLVLYKININNNVSCNKIEIFI